MKPAINEKLEAMRFHLEEGSIRDEFLDLCIEEGLDLPDDLSPEGMEAYIEAQIIRQKKRVEKPGMKMVFGKLQKLKSRAQGLAKQGRQMKKSAARTSAMRAKIQARPGSTS